VKRCSWAGTDPLLTAYHDAEWGVPSFDDRHLFEMLCLEGAQAGLSWLTILRKRQGYRRAFANFDPAAVARFDARRVETLMRNPGIVRNRAKIEAVVANGRAAISLDGADGSLARYLWRFAPKKRPVRGRAAGKVPSESAESRVLSKALRDKGFRFVGPTICYAFMEAVGMVNDHLATCFRYREVERLRGRRPPPQQS